MKHMMPVVTILVAAVLLVACGGTPTPAVEVSPTAAPALAQTASPAAEPPKDWLIFAAAKPGEEHFMLWGIRSDGSDLTQFSDERLYETGFSYLSVSPDGQHVAVLTEKDYFHGLALQLLSLPDLQLELITPLTSTETEPLDPLSTDPDPRYEILGALADAGPVWSPDSKWIAFTSAHETPSADLYVYSMEAGSITRLSDEPLQAHRPFWSLDGQHILFETLLAGSATVPAPDIAVYSAALDGTGVREIYTPQPGYGDDFAGWIDPATVLVYYPEFNSGPTNLRTVDVATGQITEITSHYIDSVALDPMSGTAVYSQSLAFDTDLISVIQEPGTYLMRTGAASPEFLIPEQAAVVRWLPAQGIFVMLMQDDGGTISITPDGEMAPFEAPKSWSDVSVSPDGTMAAWFDIEGLWVGPPGSKFQRITSDSVTSVSWSPDSQTLFYVALIPLQDNEWYRVSLPGGRPERVAKDLKIHPYELVGWLIE
jgi:hypothetical protein